MKLMLKIGTAAILLSLVGCASITGGKNQPVSIRSTCGSGIQVSGATCKVSNDKGEWHVASTPGSVVIQKAYGDVAVDCEKPSLGRGTNVFSSAASPGVYGNILVGGIIGYAIDAGSGAGFDYPQLMSVEICGGVAKVESTVTTLNTSTTGATLNASTMGAAVKPAEAAKWLNSATIYAQRMGCAKTPDVALAMGGGRERYRFECTPETAKLATTSNGNPNRTSLSMACEYGGCKEIGDVNR